MDASTEKQPRDFLKDIENDCDVWGSKPWRFYNLSRSRYIWKAKDDKLRWKRQEQFTAQFLKISNVSSLKISNITEFAKACQERPSLYDNITSYYNENAW
ncbi:unnamed protein product [Rhizopus microsporus]